MSLREAVSLQNRDENQPVSKVQAVHHLYELGLDDNAVAVCRDKVAGAPTGQVRALLANLEGVRPELIQHHISAFAKARRKV